MNKEEARQILACWLVASKGTEERLGYIEGWFDKKDEEAFHMAIEALNERPIEDMGEVSDGYHTFNQLYHQRAVLFATIVNQNKDKAWKSWKHEDGQFCFDKEGEWFIVGVDTPEGSYTYHYEKKYWDLFDCEELDRGKYWDGHTEEDVIRLLSLPPIEPKPVCEDAISRADAIDALKKDIMGGLNYEQILQSLPSVEPKRPKGELRNTIMDIYDVRPSTAEHIQTIVEAIVMIAENEYARGYAEVNEDVISKSKEGEWLIAETVDILDGRSTINVYQCNQCGGVQWGNTSFCPACGADMRGSKE